jgi:hypothetical protein
MGGEVQSPSGDEETSVRKRNLLDEAARKYVGDLSVLKEDLDIEGERDSCERVAVRAECVLLDYMNVDSRDRATLIKKRRLGAIDCRGDGNGERTDVVDCEGIGETDRFFQRRDRRCGRHENGRHVEDHQANGDAEPSLQRGPSFDFSPSSCSQPCFTPQ